MAKTFTEEHRRHISEALTGKKLTAEHRLNLSLSHKGLDNHQTGTTHSAETRQKISDLHKGNTYRKGKRHSAETREKMSEARKGVAPWNKGLKGYKAGAENHLWKGGITSADRLERIRFRNEMQKLIFERDNYTCQLCGSGGYLQVDHIQPWAEYVDQRFNLENCRTLCQSCHYEITFGKPMPEDVKAWGHNLTRKETP